MKEILQNSSKALATLLSLSDNFQIESTHNFKIQFHAEGCVRNVLRIRDERARTSAWCGGPRVTELPHNRAPVNRWMLAYIFMTAPTSVIIVKP
ncbi:hypothetical protein B5X24_HaOG216163 [Helicoverpa armigera]|nr:hypothetical protein B5X24_HaOG216163 [Helicoverpa armigera]